MIKKTIYLFALVLAISSCKNQENGEGITPSGYAYSLVSNGGAKIQAGDHAFFNFKVEDDKGNVLQVLEGDNMPVLQVPTPDNPLPQPNPIIEVLAKAAVGDSIVLTMPIDSMPGASANPKFADIKELYYISVVQDKKTDAEYKAYLEEKRLEEEKAAEEAGKRVPEIDALVQQTLKDFKSGKLTTQESPDGIKYIIHEEGTGLKPQNGMRAAVHYYGVTYDGKMFDNSLQRGRPYPFTIGQGRVIKGWDLGIPLLKVGSKASLFIPYALAYGEAGSPPNIPPKSDLMFYVELTDAN